MGKEPNLKKILKGQSKDFFTDSDQLELCELISSNKRPIELTSEQKAVLNKPGKKGVTLLWWAYLEGNLTAFKQLVESGADPDLKLEGELKFEIPISRTKGRSVLMHAARNETYRRGFVEVGIQFTKKPNQLLENQQTFAHWSVSHMMSQRQLTQLERIINADVDLNKTDSDGRTACHIAVRHNPKSLLLLLKAGADPDIPLEDGTPLVDVVRMKSVSSNPLSADYKSVLDWLNDRH